jgi:hypothetical protein
MCIVYGKASFYSVLAASIPRPAPDLPPFRVSVKFPETVILVTLHKDFEDYLFKKTNTEPFRQNRPFSVLFFHNDSAQKCM